MGVAVEAKFLIAEVSMHLLSSQDSTCIAAERLAPEWLSADRQMDSTRDIQCLHTCSRCSLLLQGEAHHKVFVDGADMVENVL